MNKEKRTHSVRRQKILPQVADREQTERKSKNSKSAEYALTKQSQAFGSAFRKKINLYPFDVAGRVLKEEVRGEELRRNAVALEGRYPSQFPTAGT